MMQNAILKYGLADDLQAAGGLTLEVAQDKLTDEEKRHEV